MPRLLSAAPHRVDLMIATAVAVVAAADFAVDGAREVSLVAVLPLSLAFALPLAWRRSNPARAITVASAAAVTLAAIGMTPADQDSSILILAFYPFSAAASGNRCDAVVSVAVAILTAVLVGVFDGSYDFIFPVIFVSLAALAGRAYGRRSSLARELQASNEEIERDREQRARRAIAAERRRIARELHDVVAHGISLMVVQAGAGRRALDPDPERAERALEVIESTGRQSLEEMRRTLEVLGSSADRSTTAPQPGLAGLEDAVEQARASGLGAVLRVEGERPPVSTGLELMLYRMVQEALTNAVRHAGPGSGCEVKLSWYPELVEVEVVDDGCGQPLRGVAGSGHGLAGMRERVALFGGQLRAGPRPSRGFAVRASIPLGAEEATASEGPEPAPLTTAAANRSPAEPPPGHRPDGEAGDCPAWERSLSPGGEVDR